MSQSNQDIMDGKGGLMLGPHRYMMIRPDALMGLFVRLPEAERLAALEAFAASITENGGKSAASYAGAGAGAKAKVNQNAYQPRKHMH
jgi:hypothetical protein